MAFGPTDQQLEKVQDDLGYHFADKWLLRQAFLHPSAGEFNNSRLSWMGSHGHLLFTQHRHPMAVVPIDPGTPIDKGDAAMQLVVSQLVFASATRGTTEILHDRRKVMVMREFCAEGSKKMGWHKLATVGKCFAKTEEEVTCNMQAELFEAVWGALFIDSQGSYKVVLDAYTKHFPLHELEPIFKAIDAVKKKDIEAREVAKRLAKKGTKPAETARPTSTTEGE